MARVLVTGGSGFIGSHLVETLVARGEQVRCLVRANSKVDLLREWGAELVVAPLDQPESLAQALADVNVVYHAAGVTKSLSSAEMNRINRDATEMLALACAAQSTPPRLVLVSSIAASGPAARGQIRIESDPAAPVSIYGRSKLAGEVAVAGVADQVPATIVRPGVVFGPRDVALLKAFRTIKLARMHFSPGFFPPPLSFIHVSDLVEILIRAADRGARLPGQENGSPGKGRYFAAAPEFPSYAELGRIVRPMLRRPFAPVVPIAGPLAWCVAGVNELRGRVSGQIDEVNFDKMREALVSSWACSGAAAQRDLDFQPPLPLAARLQETIDWYQRTGWL